MDEPNSIFLWGAPPPVPSLDEFNPRSDKWWSQYQSSLSVSPAALRELSRSSRNIGALLPDPQEWGTRPRPYKGLVVGAVQSGKTASMMGVAAVAIDQGYRIVILLAGAKDDLRQQTARRFNAQLLRQSDTIPNTAATTLGIPRGAGPLGGFALPYHLDTNKFDLLLLRMEDTLRRGEPCVIVVKKNVASLRDLQTAMNHVYTTFGVDAMPTLVFDDECDDGSVDAVDTTIPAAIANLWRRPGDIPPKTAYLGYTATSAANLLQQPDNELYPEHSVYLLRYPGEEESALQFAEPNPDAWYSGGDCFYRAFGEEPGEDANFLVSASVQSSHLSTPVELNVTLADAVRAYFVGGACRLALEPDRNFELNKPWPRPHCMLVQTSADTDEHGRWAEGITRLLGGTTLPDRSVSFSNETLCEQLAVNEAEWRKWYDLFEAARERVYRERPHPSVQKSLQWAQVKEKLPQVFERARLKVINSDVAMGSTLDFSVRKLESGEVLPPQDTFVIVVGGSKLSRGLTIEGLCVSYFVRWTDNPTEDTILQMSRWFGYRGPHLEYCRVFTSSSIAENLQQMHENDIDLRFQLAELMGEKKSPRDATMIIRANARSHPTAKMGTGLLVDLSYSPFTTVMRRVETGAMAEANQLKAKQLTDQVIARNGKKVMTIGGAQRGVLSRGWSALEVADLLDSFEFSDHNPNRDTNLQKEFYREPSSLRPMCSSFSILEDPYQVAAYLRAWANRTNGVGTAPPPLFNVGVAFGQMHEGREPFVHDLVNRQITDENRVVGGWTGRSANWDGDAFFDQPPLELRQKNSQQRLRGADGLILLYIIHKDATGRSGLGTTRTFHTPAIALSIPSGGPSFRRVIVQGDA